MDQNEISPTTNRVRLLILNVVEIRCDLDIDHDRLSVHTLQECVRMLS